MSGLRMGWQARSFSLPPMFASLPRALAIGLALHGAGFLVLRRSLGPRRLADRWEPVAAGPDHEPALPGAT